MDVTDDPRFLSLAQAAEITQRLKSILDAVPVLFARMTEQAVSPVDPGSQVAQDESAWSYSQTHDLAALFVTAALDHCAAWRLLVEGRYQPVYAHMSLLRVTFESSLAAYWLVEPGITPDVRRARTYAAQFKSLDEKRKFEEASRINISPPAQLASSRLATLIETASAEGMTRLDKNGNAILTLQMPSTVDLFDAYEDAPEGARPSWLYRFISGYSHGLQWAMMLNAQTVQPIGEHRVLGMVTADGSTTVDVTNRAVRATTRAVDAYISYRTAKA